ncbi:glycosyltransferase [Paenibacillus hodogayensis]|uniref:Glycosyltransferase n=1 Tax=Paenibacillus hodogayensis TaxID=279208 RepID=A0ABV5VTA4_9BACL
MNILLEGMFYSGHGFAEGNRMLLRFLHQAGHRVRIAAKDGKDRDLVLGAEEADAIAAFEETELDSRDLYLCNMVGTEVKHNPDYRFSIVRTTFETDRIPEEWVPELNKFDEVWVQCEFNRRTFVTSGVTVPLRLMPNFFDLDRFVPQGDKLKLPIAHSFKFLSVFDMQLRKGYDLLLEAYYAEFSQRDDAALILKVRDPEPVHKLTSLIERYTATGVELPAVYLIDQMLREEELLGLYRTCDAFVLPTRGEGWGRPFFEAMLMEKATIGTNWSGQTEFMHPGNSYLIEVERLVRIEAHENPIFNGHCWAEASVSDLRTIMRRVYKRREEAAEKGRRARSELLARYGMVKVARQIDEELDKYVRQLERRGAADEHLT